MQTTGDPDLDGLAIEYNGILVHQQAPRETATACLAYLFQRKDLCDELYLDGVDPHWKDMAACLAGTVQVRKSEVCPYLDLRAVGGGPVLDHLSRNTRHQIKRSRKLYGNIQIEAAADITDAERIWGELRALHQDYWHGKGQRSAFDNTGFDPFHERLIRQHLQTGKIQLLRVTGDRETIGCLYGFVHRGCVYAYQSGFRASSDNRTKPGLVCHSEAIELNRRLGAKIYDFLAGDARYKRSLSNTSNELLWLVIQRARAVFWLENRLKQLKRLTFSRGS